MIIMIETKNGKIMGKAKYAVAALHFHHLVRVVRAAEDVRNGKGLHAEVGGSLDLVSV